MPLSVAEGIANGVPDVIACVRYQIRHGAKLIKVSASGGVMSHSTAPGSQQYSDAEFAAIADEAHRAGVRVAAHAIGDSAIRACIRAGIDCIEHGFLATDDTIQMMVDHGTFLVSTTYLTEAIAVDRVAPELRKKAARGLPAGKGDAAEGDCGRGADRLRYRRAGDPARRERQRAGRAGRPWHDAHAGDPGGHRHQRRTHRSRSTNSAGSRPATSPTSSRCPAIRRATSPATLDVRFVMKDGQIYKRPQAEV